MIDLNRYYVASTYQGLSGSQDARSGYVPEALPGDEDKFLKSDGTWGDDKEFVLAMSIGLS